MKNETFQKIKVFAVCFAIALIVTGVLVTFVPAQQPPKRSAADYKAILKELQDRGYTFLTPETTYTGGKAVYIIHCADYSFSGADTFLAVETELGVKSTFMIRPDSKFFPQTIQRFLSIQAAGWSLGYEYDCLSRADGNMTLATVMFQAQVDYLKAFGFRLCLTDAHGDMEYNGTIDSNQIYYIHPELWRMNGLVSVFDLPKFSGYQYFSDSNNKDIVFPENLGNKVIVELHTDWW